MTVRAAFSFFCGSTPVGRALDRQPRLVQDVGVDHGGRDVGVTEQLLDGTDVVSGLEQVGGEGVAQGVWELQSMPLRPAPMVCEGGSDGAGEGLRCPGLSARVGAQGCFGGWPEKR